MDYIAINATALFKSRKTGVEWYSFQLLKYLSRVWQRGDPKVVLFAPQNLIKRSNPHNFMALKNPRWRLKPLKGKYFWTQRVLRNFLRRRPPLLLLSPSYVAPVFLKKSIPTLTVVHGLEGEYFPEVKSAQKTISEYVFYLPALKKTTKIIAVSKHTQEDLVHFFGLPRERISVVLSGPGTLDDAQVKALESQPPRKNKKVFNFLFVGGGEERKNLETGLRIFNAFQKQCRQQCRLFVSGSLKRKSKILERLLKENPQNIIKLGYVSETAKIKYLKKCHFLLYPSFYEGFGFPVLEAQMFNTVPVIIKGSGVAEIGGQGIIEVNPASQEQELAVELLKVTNSPAGYRRLQELGRQNVQKYSWRRCAEEVRKILLNCSHKDNQ